MSNGIFGQEPDPVLRLHEFFPFRDRFMPGPNSNAEISIADVVGFLASANQLTDYRGWELSSNYFAENPEGTGSGFAHFLVRNGVLTNYQAERIAVGESGKLLLGPYLLQNPIGVGSLGTTFRATRRHDGQPFAIMMLPLRSMWNVHLAKKVVQTFAEFPGLSSVVPLADIDTASGYHYLAWPFVEGESLESIVRRKGPLSLADGLRVATSSAEAFAFCRRFEIIHGCLRPSKMLITPSGGLAILEWGLGAILSENIADEESFLDTISTATAVSQNLDCVPPEVIADPLKRTESGDQYSFGCVLHFLFTGQFPFPEGNLVDKMIAHQTQRPRPLIQRNQRVPQELSDLVDRLLEKNPTSRFPDWNEPLAILRQLTLAASNGESPPISRPTAGSAVKQLEDFIDSAKTTERPQPAPTDAKKRSESQITFDFADSDGVTENSYGISVEHRGGSTGEIPQIPETDPSGNNGENDSVPLKEMKTNDYPEAVQSPRAGLEKTDFGFVLPNPIKESKLGSDFLQPDSIEVTRRESLLSRIVKSVKDRFRSWFQSKKINSERLQVCLFGTKVSSPGQTIRLQAFIHSTTTFQSITTLAKVFAPDAELLATGMTDQDIPIGAPMAAHLGVANAGIGIPLLNFSYNGEMQPKSFDVYFSWDCQAGATSGVLTVACNQIRVARLSFEISIASRSVARSSWMKGDSRVLLGK